MPVTGIIALLFLYISTFIYTLGNGQFLSVIFLALFAMFFLKFIALKVGRINSVVFFFFFFYLVYGITAPVSILLGGGIPSIFSKPYALNEYLFAFSLSTTGIVIALITTTFKNIESNRLSSYESLRSRKSALLSTAVFLCVLSAIFEFINSLRVGFDSFLLDKAEYQSKLQALSFTLPTSKLYLTALILFCLGVALKGRDVKKWQVVVFLLAILPSILIHLITGQRGYLLTLVGAAFLSLTYFKHIKLSTIKVKYIVLATTLYILLVLLTVIRGVLGYSIETGDFSLVQERLSDSEMIIKRLNPAESEFGAPFGNFSEFMIRNDDTFEYGRTYIIAPVVLIPGIIFPGEKPTQAIYAFRDKYFQNEKYRGEIASTGFSSILEAYMNFGYLGVFLFYLVLTKVIFRLETLTYYTAGLFLPLFSISLFNLSRSFHRSGFDTFIGEVFWAILLATFAVLLTSFIGRIKFK